MAWFLWLFCSSEWAYWDRIVISLSLLYFRIFCSLQVFLSKMSFCQILILWSQWAANSSVKSLNEWLQVYQLDEALQEFASYSGQIHHFIVTSLNAITYYCFVQIALSFFVYPIFCTLDFISLVQSFHITSQCERHIHVKLLLRNII